MSESELYDAWIADGEPWRNAKPVGELVAKLRQARPAAAAAGCFGTIGNIDHLLADPPQDHCPYSQTGWPLPHPYPSVTAADIMHRPDLGVDCDAIHAHLLASVRAGRLPWLKYWIWKGWRYDVRNNWVPVPASGHFDHIHMSGRTDHIGTSIGSWHPLPGYGDIMKFIARVEGNPACWLSDYMTLRPIQDYKTLLRLRAKGFPEEVFETEAAMLDEGGEKDTLGPDPVTLTPEQLTLVEQSAAAGAKEGVAESMTPQAIAAAIPDDLASEVVDLLAARLAAR